MTQEAVAAVLAALPPVLHLEVSTGLALLVALAVGLWARGRRRW